MTQQPAGNIACYLLLVLLWQLPPIAPASADDATPTVRAGVDAYNRGDIDTAFHLLSAEAAHGNSDAQVNLGYMYARGLGVTANQTEALRLYRLSAGQGNGEGMNAVGYKYQFGTGVAPDIQTAIDWYCRAIARGNPRALNNLAILHDNGIGVPRDADEARSLWRQAAQRGHANAAYNLGMSLLQVPSALRDAREGLLWLQRAAWSGQLAAQRELRARGDTSPFPPPFDIAAAMVIQPKDIPPGHARYCGAPIS